MDSSVGGAGPSARPTPPCAARTSAASRASSGPTAAGSRGVLGLIFVSALLGMVSPFLLREILDEAIPERRHAAAERCSSAA